MVIFIENGIGKLNSLGVIIFWVLCGFLSHHSVLLPDVLTRKCSVVDIHLWLMKNRICEWIKQSPITNTQKIICKQCYTHCQPWQRLMLHTWVYLYSYFSSGDVKFWIAINFKIWEDCLHIVFLFILISYSYTHICICVQVCI